MAAQTLFQGKRLDNGAWATGYFVESEHDTYRAYIVTSAHWETDEYGNLDMLDTTVYEVDPSTIKEYTKPASSPKPNAGSAKTDTDSLICGATGLPCSHCQPGPCESHNRVVNKDLISRKALIHTLVKNGWLKMNPLEDSSEMIAVQAAIDYAPSAEVFSNCPLTLDELKGMDGEPIWTVALNARDLGHWELCSCEIIAAYPLHRVLRCVSSNGEVNDHEFETYGVSWIAYRNKPENK